jgi:hypothetical protein
MCVVVANGDGGGSGFGDRFVRALVFAAQTHRDQCRKGSGVPYIGHLLGVCSLVSEDGGDEDDAIAALLHDAVEDQGGRVMLEEIRSQFGHAVADVVLACSDTTEEPKPPWRERKEAYLAHSEGQPPSVLRVSLADKLFNARAILRDFLDIGDEVWERFREGRDAQLWYYSELTAVFKREMPGRTVSELESTVSELNRLVGPADDADAESVMPVTARPGPSGIDNERLRWIDAALATTTAWIEREANEAKGELSFSRPGEWDYDYNTDVLSQTKQAAKTVDALRAEREVIRGVKVDAVPLASPLSGAGMLGG